MYRQALHSISGEPQQARPVWTNQCTTREEGVPGFTDIRAYKLGKKRRSYNKCTLSVCKAREDLLCQTNAQTLTVSQIAEVLQHKGSENQVSYQVQLSNGSLILVDIFVVYSQPVGMQQEQWQRQPDKTLAAGTSYQWNPVTRGVCRKGCTGPILRNIQRLGRLGRIDCRSAPKAMFDSLPLTTASGRKMASKDSRYMWLSIDEAGNHVGNHSFRLVARAHDESGELLLGTGCSPPIRVLSNNDVTTGAASISITLILRADWKGWDQLPAAGGPIGISQMMCSPLGPFLERQQQPAQAETDLEAQSSSSEPSGPIPLQPPSDLDADGFTDTSPFGLCGDRESCVLPPQPVPEEVSMQHCEAAHSPCEAPTFKLTSPHTTAQTPRHTSRLYNHVHNHRAECLLKHASGSVSTERGMPSTVGQLLNRPGSVDDELLKMIEHAQQSMAVAVQCISAAAAAVSAPASDRCAQPQPHRRNTGYAELRSSCGLDTVHSDVCEPYEGSSRQMRLALDHHEKTVQLCRSRSPWDSKHTCSLPLKRSRANGAAELSCHDATLPPPQSLQRCVTAKPKGFSAHSAALCMRNLQGLANQGQANMAAIQERVSLWQQQGASTEGVPAEERFPIGFLATPRHDDQVSSIQAELQLWQQHAPGHLRGCSPQASSYPAVHQDTRSKWSSSSTSMQQGCTFRDPRQDAGGGKRLCSAQSINIAASPIDPRLCFASAASSPHMTRDEHPYLQAPSSLAAWRSSHVVRCDCPPLASRPV